MLILGNFLEAFFNLIIFLLPSTLANPHFVAQRVATFLIAGLFFAFCLSFYDLIGRDMIPRSSIRLELFNNRLDGQQIISVCPLRCTAIAAFDQGSAKCFIGG